MEFMLLQEKYEGQALVLAALPFINTLPEAFTFECIKQYPGEVKLFFYILFTIKNLKLICKSFSHN